MWNVWVTMLYVRCGVMLAACGYKIDEAHETKKNNISGIYVKFLVFNIYGSWWCMCRSAPKPTTQDHLLVKMCRRVLCGVPVAAYSSLTHTKDVTLQTRNTYSKWYRMNSLDVSGMSPSSDSTVIYTPEICILYECNFRLQGGLFI